MTSCPSDFMIFVSPVSGHITMAHSARSDPPSCPQLSAVVHSCPQLSTVVCAPKYGSVRVVRAPSALRLQSGVTPLPWSRVRATLYSCGGAAAGRVPRRTVHAGRSSVRHSAAPHQSFKQIFAKISQSQIRDQAPTIGPSPG